MTGRASQERRWPPRRPTKVLAHLMRQQSRYPQWSPPMASRKSARRWHAKARHLRLRRLFIAYRLEPGAAILTYEQWLHSAQRRATEHHEARQVLVHAR